MKRAFLSFFCIALFAVLLCASCKEGEQLPQDDVSGTAYLDNCTMQQINEKIEQRWQRYLNHCEEVSLSGLAEDILDSAENPMKYVYRTVQYKMFDTVTDNRFASGGIYNYDLCFYQDGTAELIYRHFDEGTPYVLLREMHIALDSEEQSRIETTLSEWDLASIPTWNPEEPFGVDGETTYILGTDGYTPHLASMWCAGEQYGIYHIRTALEEIVRAHAPESVYDAFLSGEMSVTYNGADCYVTEFYPSGKNQKGNGYAYLNVIGDEDPELLLRTPTSYTIIANGEDGLYVHAYASADEYYLHDAKVTKEEYEKQTAPYLSVDSDGIVWLLYR